MDAFIKGFLGLFIAAVITYIAVGTISAELDASSARGFMDSAKKEIAESNFSGNVIQEVGRTAKEMVMLLKLMCMAKRVESRVLLMVRMKAEALEIPRM